MLGNTTCTTDTDCSGLANAKCDAKKKVCNCADLYKQANTTACILKGNLFIYLFIDMIILT